MAPWRSPHDQSNARKAEHRLKKLQRGFQKVSRRRDRRAATWSLATFLRVFVALVLVGEIGLYTSMAVDPSWSAGVIARHFIAAGGCKYARAVDLAPAARGEPGYWSHLDADDDGIACEPWHGYRHYRRHW